MRRMKQRPFWPLMILIILAVAAVVSMQPQKRGTASLTPSNSPERRNQLTVYYLDVGQGDSEFIELPDGRSMLIDAGNPENGGQIARFLDTQSIKKIDYLVATHPHADHIGGMPQVVQSIDIGSVYMPKVSATSRTFENLLSSIQKKGLQIQTARAGVTLLDRGDLKAVLVAPVGSGYNDLNQYSAVIKLSYDNTSFLFMGDAGAQSEKEITADVRADVLKVGHHGSDTASTEAFLKRVSPRYAVIEVGKDNSYGHPAESTLKKLRRIGAEIYRTDEDGTIKIQSDGNNITVEEHVPGMEEADASMRPAA
ncbi:ComEC/Rec2 family competence protein [Caproicibacter fermentans]|uniref:MBL fold metallo-hydrolase n=1 Tax=Caproicibacter fermentans TaxID=2576756 RepID=A0A7G8TBI3_9FIRM|nr:ComEC/Rec2 family competence protein [Caproicibacter fermentans]QNK40974.1 MBL fold metallo-hydrolase [Caproicibacter fermentans]